MLCDKDKKFLNNLIKNSDRYVVFACAQCVQSFDQNQSVTTKLGNTFVFQESEIQIFEISHIVGELSNNVVEYAKQVQKIKKTAMLEKFPKKVELAIYNGDILEYNSPEFGSLFCTDFVSDYASNVVIYAFKHVHLKDVKLIVGECND